jgi:hypothetical protein
VQIHFCVGRNGRHFANSEGLKFGVQGRFGSVATWSYDATSHLLSLTWQRPGRTNGGRFSAVGYSYGTNAHPRIGGDLLKDKTNIIGTWVIYNPARTHPGTLPYYSCIYGR